jgi:hypothetical protein
MEDAAFSVVEKQHVAVSDGVCVRTVLDTNAAVVVDAGGAHVVRPPIVEPEPKPVALVVVSHVVVEVPLPHALVGGLTWCSSGIRGRTCFHAIRIPLNLG